MLGPEEIRSYQVYLTNERTLAPSSIQIAIAALRFLYRSRSRRSGRSRGSSRLRRRRRSCRLFAASRKSGRLSTASGASGTTRS
jgi:hypothetical protein